MKDSSSPVGFMRDDEEDSSPVQLNTGEFFNEDVLKELLLKHKAEARDMLFTEYDEETHINNEKKISYEDGMDKLRRLYKQLKELGRLDDFDRAMNDNEYRDQLINELLNDDNTSE